MHQNLRHEIGVVRCIAILFHILQKILKFNFIILMDEIIPVFFIFTGSLLTPSWAFQRLQDNVS